MQVTKLNILSLNDKKALLLDMNSTFMFGEDRFSEDEDFITTFKEQGGDPDKININLIIRDVYDYLDRRYPDERYRHNFPSLAEAINEIVTQELSATDVDRIINTFACHEHGYIPDDYLQALFQLYEHYTLASVIDIWSPKARWVETFHRLGLSDVFKAVSFSSDHGMVKPSPRPFEMVVEQLGVAKQDCLVIGDSARRDLGGAMAAGIDCVLLGEHQASGAVATFPNLLQLTNVLIESENKPA